jgi:hypothetical protein
MCQAELWAANGSLTTVPMDHFTIEADFFRASRRREKFKFCPVTSLALELHMLKMLPDDHSETSFAEGTSLRDSADGLEKHLGQVGVRRKIRCLE